VISRLGTGMSLAFFTVHGHKLVNPLTVTVTQLATTLFLESGVTVHICKRLGLVSGTVTFLSDSEVGTSGGTV
jgi:hypothetical protein